MTLQPHAILALAAAAFACATPTLARAADVAAPASLDLRYDVVARENKVVPLGGTCPVHVIAPTDERQNKETIGATLSGALATGEAGPWISEALAHLGDYGFAVDTVASSAAPANGVTVKATLIRAYTWQIGLKLFSMVALKVEFIDRNGPLQQKYYRAHGDKTNMVGADSEHLTTLNYGINNLLRALAGDLVSLCKGVKVEPYTYAGPDAVMKK